jgi:Na+-translocating ferredoxin:NAD+ oxidoreductase subunit B
VRARIASAEEVDALLPQTQCTRCGYSGCLPYAQAIVAVAVPINQCPPGGAATIAALAALLGRPPIPLNPENGTEGPPLVAQIDEEACIGCAKCLPPCPVDAIVGAQRQMHTVLTDVCTGCELCVAPCPVDCIAMVPRADGIAAPGPEENRSRYSLHLARAGARDHARAALLAERKQAAAGG